MTAAVCMLLWMTGVERLRWAGADAPNLSLRYARHVVYSGGDSLAWEENRTEIRMLYGSPSAFSAEAPIGFLFFRRASPYFPHPLFAPDAYRCDVVGDTVFFRRKGIRGKAFPPHYFEIHYHDAVLRQSCSKTGDEWTIVTRYVSSCVEYRGEMRAVEIPPPRFRRLLQDAADATVEIGPVEWVLPRTYLYNVAEKHRLGLGIQTGDQLWDKGRFGGWVGYGTGDRRLKFALWGECYPLRRDFRLRYEYLDDLHPTGRPVLGGATFRPFFNRSPTPFHPRLLYTPFFDYVQSHTLTLDFPMRRALSGRITAARRNVVPSYVFRHAGVDTAITRPRFTVMTAGVALRWAPRKPSLVVEGECEKSFVRPHDYGFLALAYTHGFRWARVWRAELWLRAQRTFSCSGTPLSFATLLPANGVPVVGADPYALNTLPINVLGRVRVAEGLVIGGVSLRWAAERRWIPDLVWRCTGAFGGAQNPSTRFFHLETGASVLKLLPLPPLDRLGFGFYCGFNPSGFHYSYKLEIDLP